VRDSIDQHPPQKLRIVALDLANLTRDILRNLIHRQVDRLNSSLRGMTGHRIAKRTRKLKKGHAPPAAGGSFENRSDVLSVA
jgi:hypothetical protein